MRRGQGLCLRDVDVEAVVVARLEGREPGLRRLRRHKDALPAANGEQDICRDILRTHIYLYIHTHMRIYTYADGREAAGGRA